MHVIASYFLVVVEEGFELTSVFFTVGLDGGVQPLDSGVFFEVQHEVTSEPAGSLHPVLNSVILSLEVVDEGVLTNRLHFQE